MKINKNLIFSIFFSIYSLAIILVIFIKTNINDNNISKYKNKFVYLLIYLACSYVFRKKPKENTID